MRHTGGTWKGFGLPFETQQIVCVVKDGQPFLVIRKLQRAICIWKLDDLHDMDDAVLYFLTLLEVAASELAARPLLQFAGLLRQRLRMFRIGVPPFPLHSTLIQILRP